jgi:hypothetical protein
MPRIARYMKGSIYNIGNFILAVAAIFKNAPT